MPGKSKVLQKFHYHYYHHYGYYHHHHHYTRTLYPCTPILQFPKLLLIGLLIGSKSKEYSLYGSVGQRMSLGNSQAMSLVSAPKVRVIPITLFY